MTGALLLNILSYKTVYLVFFNGVQKMIQVEGLRSICFDLVSVQLEVVNVESKFAG